MTQTQTRHDAQRQGARGERGRSWALCCALVLGLFSLHVSTVGASDLFLRHLRFLASDALQGRGNTGPGLARSADYIARQYERSGLLPSGDDGSYFQTFQVTTGVELGGDCSVSLFAVAFSPFHLEQGIDYIPLSYGGVDAVTGPLAFVGYGISAPEYHYDDYRHIDVQGKVVLMWEHEPQENWEESPFAGLDLTPHSTVMTKVMTAKHHGAIGVILVPDFFNHRYRKRGFDRFPVQDIEDMGIQAILVNDQWGRRLMGLSGRDLAQLKRWFNVHLTPMPFDFEGVSAAVSLDVIKERTELRNVLGVSPGRSGRTLIIGAHYDHLGLGGKSTLAPEQLGQVHNGADDNASGTAGMMQLADELAALQPELNLVFAAFAGEELGLLGSRYYVEHPVYPLEDTVAMLNLDMIGRSRGELMVGGVGTASEFRSIFDQIEQVTPLKLNLAETPNGPSDHLSFAVKRIPVLFFFSGFHADYHKPSDDWQKIDLVRSRQVLDVVRDVIEQLDELEGRVTYVDLGADLPGVFSHPDQNPRSYFGSIPDMGYDGPGLRFSQVREESPADSAGLRAGDILLEFGGKRIDNLYDFTFVLRTLEPGDRVEVIIQRGGRSHSIEVFLEAWPGTR